MQKTLHFSSLPDFPEFAVDFIGLAAPFSVEAVQGERYELLDSETIGDLYDFLFQIENGIDPKQPFALDIIDAEEPFEEDPSLTAAERNPSMLAQ